MNIQEVKMSRPVGLMAMLLCAPTLLPAQHLLAAGTVLVYRTPDGTEREWLVEEATPLAHATLSGCMQVRYAAGGPTAGPDERRTCVAGDTLLRWSPTTNGWQIARPIGPADSLDLPLRSGMARYLTGAVTVDTISGFPVPVVATTVLTIDSTGRVSRRLQERFAPGLGTATWGRFEVPDTTSASGWRTAQEFGISAIRRPSGAP
jgi:hypothetical protein